MPYPSRLRRTTAHITVSSAVLSLALAAAAGADSTKPTPLPSLPSPIQHSQTATTKTSTSSTSSNPYNWAAPPPVLPTTTIYNGQDGAKSGITVVAWGGGSGGDSTDMSYTRGGHAIKVVTHGLYEGAKLNFNPAVKLSGENPATNRIIQLVIRFGESSDEDEDTSKVDPRSAPRTYAVSNATGNSIFPSNVYTADSAPRGWLRLAQSYPGYGGGGYPGNPMTRRRGVAPGYQGPGYPGPGYPGPGYPGAAYPGTKPGQTFNPLGGDTPWNPPIHFFRLLFTLQNGAQAEILRPTPWPKAFEDPDSAWLSVSVPLSLLKFGSGQGDSPLASLTVGGDGPSTFYIGQMNLVDDNAPITCSAGPAQDVAAGDDVTFTARAEGGASMLTYSWDFDSSDGIIDEADGAVVTHKYDKGSKDYTATLTVSDLDGIKKPCTSTVKIKVEE